MAKKQSTAQKGLFSKSVPKMPEGYYSGDKPNPNLSAFVQAHLRDKPYDAATDKYNVPAFDKPIETTKATAIYNMHTYWSKKPHDAIRQYIRHYTQPGDLVLDPFCGSGGTALAALMEGRKAIAIDRSPAATFITKNYCTPVDVNELQAAFEELKRKVKPEIDWLYETRCDRCGGKATTAYTVYSQVFQCPRCMNKVALFDCEEAESETKAGKAKTISVCPHCAKRGITEEIGARAERFGAIPVLVNYKCENGCKPARGERRHNDADKKKREYFEKYDLAKISEIEAKPIPYWYPTNRMMNVPEGQQRWALLWRPYHGDIERVSDFFTKRNLWAVAAYFDGVSQVIASYHVHAVLKGLITAIIYGLTKMNRHRPDVSFPLNYSANTLYVPPISSEQEPWHHIENKLEKVLSGYASIVEDNTTKVWQVYISTDDARDLTSIPSNSIDYVFTDPPYGYRIQYGELNFIWESWLNLDYTWQSDEIIINENRHLSELEWASRLQASLSEIHRVLKPGHYVSLCFHDSDPHIWELLQDTVAEVGFLSSSGGGSIETNYHTHKQSVSEDITMRDLVLNFRKPKLGEITADIAITGDEDATTFGEKVRTIVRDYLTAHPGSTKDRIYDEVVSRMVRAGQMQAHNFDELLAQVAESSQATGQENRWYLKESAIAVVDAAESAKEDTAADNLGKFIAKKMKANPESEGVHYSDLFEQYVYAVKEKPRRTLTDWLPDYFYKTDDGTWRLPATDEEAEAKKKGRTSGTNRRIKRYIAYLQQAVSVPAHEQPNDATLAEWIRHCKRAGLYEQGKLLYEKGGLNVDALNEEMLVNVEEDYQVCVRMIARAKAEK
jgi:DNA modification methylase